MKIKFSREKIATLLILVAIFTGIIYYAMFLRPIKSWNYHGQKFNFRGDLRKAAKVPVYPNEDEVYQNFVNDQIGNITIVYRDSGQYGYYATSSFEITHKMFFYYKLLAELNFINKNEIPVFNVEKVDEYSNISGTPKNPKIILVGPKFAEDTKLETEDSVIYVSGETEGKLDLATAKFLMIILNIDLENPDNSIIR